MSETSWKKSKYTPPKPVEAVAKEAEAAPKKAVIARFCIYQHPDNSYTADIGGEDLDLKVLISACDALQNSLMEMHKVLMVQAQQQRRNALASIPMMPVQ